MTTKNETRNEMAGNELATVKTPAGAELRLAATEGTISALDDLAKQGALTQNISSQFKRIFVTGAVMYNMNQILTPAVMQNIVWLQNSPMGFLTDKPQGYDVDTVRACVIEAAIKGLDVIGNEFNIIAGRFYATKNGLNHMLRNIPGLAKNVTPGIPKMLREGEATVTVHVDWTYGGKHSEKDVEFAIRVNKGMGADAIIGKAKRKAYAWLYEEVTGNAAAEGDVTDTLVPVDAGASGVKVSPLEQTQAESEPSVAEPEVVPVDENGNLLM